MKNLKRVDSCLKKTNFDVNFSREVLHILQNKGGEKVKKKNRKSLLVIALLLMVGISMGYVAKTYAKYTAEVTGDGTAKVAKWAFEDDNDITTIDIDLAQTYDATTLVADRIAPGTEGSFEIELVNTNSEVGVDFTVELGTVTNVPTNLKFYKDSGYTTELVPGTGKLTGQIKAGDSTGVKPKIYWKWVYETGTVTNGVATGDAADTADGEAAKTLTIPITVKGVQTRPSTTAITSHID